MSGYNSSNARPKCRKLMLQGRLCGNTVVILSVANLAVSMFILDENSLVCEVTGKGDGRNSETREGALEAVPAGEWASVSPCLTVGRRSERVDRTKGRSGVTHYLAHGSFAGAPDEAANLEGSKPVRLGLGAIVKLRRVVSAMS